MNAFKKKPRFHERFQKMYVIVSTIGIPTTF